MTVVVAGGLVLAPPVAELETPLAYPRILWDDITRRGSVVASSEAEGFEAENAADYLTFDYWRPASVPATYEIQADDTEEVDCILIAAHDIGSSGASILIEYHDGDDYIEIVELQPGTDDVLIVLMDEAVETMKVRLTLSGEIASLGVVMAGKALAMPKSVSLDHRPIGLSRRTVIEPNDSEGGQWLGRTIRRNGVETELKFQHLTRDFVRGEFDDFRLAARSYPFGLLWAPERFPAEAAYCRCDQDIIPAHDGIPDRMSVTIPVKGIID
jgi:hypothetical protein